MMVYDTAIPVASVRWFKLRAYPVGSAWGYVHFGFGDRVMSFRVPMRYGQMIRESFMNSTKGMGQRPTSTAKTGRKRTTIPTTRPRNVGAGPLSSRNRR